MREDQVHIGANQLGGQFGKSLVVPLRPAVLDGDVRTLDITEVAQTQADSLKPRGKRRWRCQAEESDPRHFAWLLRPRRKRPRGRAAQECDEVAPAHAEKAYQRAALCVTAKLAPNDRFGSFSSDRQAPDAHGMSASLQKQTCARLPRYVRFVPKGDIRIAAADK